MRGDGEFIKWGRRVPDIRPDIVLDAGEFGRLFGFKLKPGEGPIEITTAIGVKDGAK